MRSKLTEFEEAFIILNLGKLTVEQFIEKIKKVDPEVIKKFLDNHPIEKDTKVEPSMPIVDDILAKKSGAVIMTEAASLLSQENTTPKRNHSNGCTVKAKTR